MSLKIYAWEHETFKDLYNLHLMPDVRKEIIFTLANFFGIKLNPIEGVSFTTQRNGRAYSRQGRIYLPRRGCPVGLVCHELAHVYDWQFNGKDGHRKSFKKALIKLMIETKYELPRILKAVGHVR